MSFHRNDRDRRIVSLAAMLALLVLAPFLAAAGAAAGEIERGQPYVLVTDVESGRPLARLARGDTVDMAKGQRVRMEMRQRLSGDRDRALRARFEVKNESKVEVLRNDVGSGLVFRGTTVHQSGATPIQFHLLDPIDVDPDGYVYARISPGSFEIVDGDRCETGDRICYDQGGPSVALTRLYFGDRAAADLQDSLRRPPRSDSAIFEPIAGVRCDRDREVCFDRDGDPNVALTALYFGEDAAARLPGVPGERVIFEPRDGVVCNRERQRCYDRYGVDLEETRRQFGSDAADELAREIGRQPSTVVFEPLRGVVCDRSVEECYDEEGADVEMTRRYFGDAAARALADRLDDVESAAGVMLFEHVGFRGRSQTVRSSIEDLRWEEIGSDRISSVRVPPGCEVVLYRDVGFVGPATRLTSDRWDLRGTDVGNDTASSVRVHCQ